MTTVLQYLNECLIGRQFEGVLFTLEVLIIHEVWRSGTVQISGEVAKCSYLWENGVSPPSFCNLSYNGNAEELFQTNLELGRILVPMLPFGFIPPGQRDPLGLIIDLFRPMTLNGLVDSANTKAQM